MPIYEYKCKDCHTHIERRQKITDDPLTTCENCGGTLEKQWSRTGFQFKGEGWYVTDYAKKSGAKSESGSAGESSSTPATTATPDSASKPKSD